MVGAGFGLIESVCLCCRPGLFVAAGSVRGGPLGRMLLGDAAALHGQYPPHACALLGCRGRRHFPVGMAWRVLLKCPGMALLMFLLSCIAVQVVLGAGQWASGGFSLTASQQLLSGTHRTVHVWSSVNFFVPFAGP